MIILRATFFFEVDFREPYMGNTVPVKIEVRIDPLAVDEDDCVKVILIDPIDGVKHNAKFKGHRDDS